jgi:hypothetical protein
MGAQALLAMGLPTVASAQDLDSVPGLQERVAHERSVVHQLLEAGECPRSCLALEAMRQAADRICRMDSGDPGKVGRSNLEQTADIVLAQCPSCEDAREIADPSLAGGVANQPSVACSTYAPAPVKVPESGGGCASCGIIDRTSNGEYAAVGSMSVLALALSRRRRTSPTPGSSRPCRRA